MSGLGVSCLARNWTELDNHCSSMYKGEEKKILLIAKVIWTNFSAGGPKQQKILFEQTKKISY